MFRKFYAATTEGAGAATETVQFSSMAEAMAKIGTKSDENSQVAIPINREDKVETKAEETTQAATAKVEENAETKTETPEKTEVKTEEPAKTDLVKEVKATPVLSLDEVLKNEQPNTILKKLGFNDEALDLVNDLKEVDPKVLGILQAYKQGTLGDYVRELSVDYNKMSAEDVMRHQLRLEYPKASPEAFEALYQSEVVDKYKIDPDTYTETEVSRGKLLIEAIADKKRDDLIANQQKYLMPAKPEPKAPSGPSPEEVQKQQLDTYRKELTENPHVKSIIANKSVTIGEGEEKFNYPVDANSLIDILVDPAKWVDTMYDKDGEHYVPKTEHQMLVAAFSQDSKKFLSEYAKHLKSLGAKEVIDPIENASQPDKSTATKSEAEPKSMAEAMARHGRKA